MGSSRDESDVGPKHFLGRDERSTNKKDEISSGEWNGG